MIWLCLQLALAGPLDEAAASIEAGDPESAIELLEPLAADPAASAAVHYNLGTAYLESGALPRAVAHLRAAHARSPRAADPAHNLALARGRLTALPDPVPPTAAWMAVLTPVELGLIGVLLVCLGSGGLVWRRRRREGLTIPAAVSGLGLVLGATASWGQLAAATDPVAVLVDAARLRDAPRMDAGERAVLPAGSETRVNAVHPDFLLVETGDGTRGWVSRHATELVVH